MRRVEFLGQKRLAAGDIAAIQRWVDEGASQGNPNDLPPPPAANSGWQLGMTTGQDAAAVVSFRQALTIRGDHMSALSGLGWVLATSPDPGQRNPKEALAASQLAAQLSGRGPGGDEYASRRACVHSRLRWCRFCRRGGCRNFESPRYVC